MITPSIKSELINDLEIFRFLELSIDIRLFKIS